MSMNKQWAIKQVIWALKRHHIRQESQFWREERRKNRESLSPFFGWEKEKIIYQKRLIERWLYHRQDSIASAIIDVLLEQNNKNKISDLHKFHWSNEVITLMTENSSSWGIVPILSHQKKMIQELFASINWLEAIEYWVKKFIHNTHKDFRSTWFEEFWYTINKETFQKSINTKYFRHQIESTLAMLPTKLLQEANDDILTAFIKQQLNILSQWKKQFNYAVIKDKYNWIYDTEKWIMVVINTAPNNTDNIIILREGWEHTLITKLNSSKYPGLYREIEHIQDIFVHHEWFQSFFCGKVTIKWSEKEFFFDGTKIIEQFNQQDIENFEIFSEGKVIVAAFLDAQGIVTKHMFVRKINPYYERMQITHFVDQQTQKTHYIESIIEIDTSWWKVYAHVLVKGWPSKKVHVIPFNDLRTISVRTD